MFVQFTLCATYYKQKTESNTMPNDERENCANRNFSVHILFALFSALVIISLVCCECWNIIRFNAYMKYRMQTANSKHIHVFIIFIGEPRILSLPFENTMAEK